MKVVVTGATGHIGANLVRELVQQGNEVRAISLSQQHAVALQGLDINHELMDIRNYEGLCSLFKGYEAVYHLAGVISITGGLKGKVAEVNVQGAKNVAEAALHCGLRRMIHVSSIHAFRQKPLSKPLDENRHRVSSKKYPIYDRSKAAGGREVRKVIARGLDAVIIHPTGVIGPYDFTPSRMGQAFLAMYHRKFPALINGGFNWVDVRDVVRTMISAEQKGHCGDSYLVPGHWHSVQELAKIVELVTGVKMPKAVTPMWLARLAAPVVTTYARINKKEPLFTSESLQALRANKVILSQKAAKELGHTARPIDDTIRDVFAWFERMGKI